MHEHDEITERLRRLGTTPVPGDVRDGHLHTMRASAGERADRQRFGRLAVAAAAIVGVAVGSTGFAMAGALPAPAQGLAHDVLSVVQVQVPDRPANHGSCVSQAAKLDNPADKRAAKELCRTTNPAGPPPGVGKGRPEGTGEGQGRSGEAPGKAAKPAGHPNADTSDCRGKPPWAGKKGEASEQARNDFLAGCPDRADDATEDAAEAAEEQRERGAEEQGEAPEQAPAADPPVGSPPVADPPAADPPAATPPVADPPAADPPVGSPPADAGADGQPEDPSAPADG